ncbi:Vibriobactin utilization protein ViuB [compost metagenome]
MKHDNNNPGRPIPSERRLLVAAVREVHLVTPHMKRITVGSNALEGFPVRRPAQWVKLFVPTPESEKPSGRAYTIRYYYKGDAEMDIDFVLHGDGPCSSWAEQVRIGDVIQLAGPRGGFSLTPDVTHLLIGGDETALPAIGAILEDLPAGIKVTAFIEIPDRRDIQTIVTMADADITWLPRNGSPAGTGTALQEAMTAASLPQGQSEVWFAAESTVVRMVRRHFQNDRQFDRSRITASGYWKSGETDFRDAEGDER